MSRRLAILGAVVLAIAALLALVRGPRAPNALHTPDRAPPHVETAPRPFAPSPAAPALAAVEPPPPVPAAGPAVQRVLRKPLIERVDVEDPAPCAGADVRVDVRLSAPAVKVVIQHEPGNPAVLQFAQPGPATVLVVARDFADGLDTRELTFDVRDCGDAGDGLRVDVDPLARDRVAFDVAGARGLALAWDFGDGAAEDTAAPHAVHDYALRPQDGPYSTFIVTVAARAEPTLARRVALTLVNNHWLASTGGALQLPVQGGPFAEAVPGGWAADIVVRNIAPDPVTFASAELHGFPCARAAPAESTTLPASAVTGLARLAPDETAAARLQLEARAWSVPVCTAEVRLLGATPDGRPAVAMVALRLQTPSDAPRVTDRAHAERVRRAAQLLGRERVTEEELRRLEREGRL